MTLNFNLDSFIKAYVTKRPESLLAADFARYAEPLHQRLDGKRVLVIGGAGTIGSNYIKALLRFPVAKLVVVDIDENNLTELVRDLRSSDGLHIPEDFTTYPVDFGSETFERLFHHHAPFDVVANFAARKHVRSEKDIFSIEAMCETNVFMARRLLDLLLKSPPEAFFCVSTDKAANPVNVMGATKKLMEDLILSYANELPIKTARFANVAFSNGSLPLGWLNRLRLWQPLSCPLGIRRFFVSPIESGELCLIASVLGASGDIFFPKLDETRDMIPFDAIVKDLLDALNLGTCACNDSATAKARADRLRQQLASTNLSADATANFIRSQGGYPVEFFASNTSGEKTFEEFFTVTERLDTESFTNLGIVKETPLHPRAEVEAIIAELQGLFRSNKADKAAIVSALAAYLPNFHHIEKGRSLDNRM
ncbi:MAG: polysaccharide biosynthesis protein [Candidatus Spyradenecus sp.]